MFIDTNHLNVQVLPKGFKGSRHHLNVQEKEITLMLKNITVLITNLLN